MTTITVRCGDVEGAIYRAEGGAGDLRHRWESKRLLVITVPPGARVLSRREYLEALGIGIEFEPHLGEASLVFGRLPPRQWPQTCIAGAKQVAESLSEESRTIVRDLPNEDLREMRLYWGAMLARHFALYNGNSRMLQSCGGAAATAGVSLVDLVSDQVQER